MKFYVCSPLFIALFIFLGFTAVGQDTPQASYSVADTLVKPEQQNQHYFKPRSVILPAAFLLYGSLKPAVKGIQNLDDDIMHQVKTRYPDFHTNAEDYLIWAPSASIYLMDALHVKTRHSFQEHLILDAGSMIVAGGVGFVMRKISGNIDAYNTHNTNFPSGHTVNVFRGAEIVHQELKETHPVWSYSGYLVATTVGVLRIYNKDHLLTEVLAGAGLGILSTKLTYWVFDKVKYRKKK
jgi:membrane-associated phospholipid phosphatase